MLKIKIVKSKINIKLFPETDNKPKRFTPQEYETELEICKWLKRPPRYFKTDTPFYPWVVPEPKVNFMLNYKE